MSASQNEDTKKPKRIRSKQKGNGFEGTIAKTLTRALQPLNFIRTPGSGARVGGKNFETIGQMFGEDALKIFVGDVVPVNERQEGLTFKWSVECKAYATPDSATALFTNKANIFKWFEESVVDAMKTGKQPMLVVKWNHTPIFVVVDSNGAMDSVLCAKEAGIEPGITLLTYGSVKRALDVYELDAVLQCKAFWFAHNVS